MLYILLLPNKEAFKVGITTVKDLSRIKNLNRLYSFDLANSYIVEFKNYKTLEKQLHADYKQYQYTFDKKIDGCTEFLKMDCLPFVLEDIEYKAKRLDLKIKKGIEWTIEEPIVKEKPIKKSKERKFIHYKDAYDKYFNITHDELKDFMWYTVDQIMLPLEYISKPFEFMCKQIAIHKDSFDTVTKKNVFDGKYEEVIKCNNLFLAALLFKYRFGGTLDILEKKYCYLHPHEQYRKTMNNIISRKAILA